MRAASGVCVRARCCMSVQGGLRDGGREGGSSMETKGNQLQQGMNKEEKEFGSVSAQSVSHRRVESTGATASCSF